MFIFPAIWPVSYTHLAQKITKLYQEHGVKAIAIDSKTPATERQQDIEAFKKGDIQVLVNVCLLYTSNTSQKDFRFLS